MNTLPIQIAWKESTDGQKFLVLSQSGEELLLTVEQTRTLARTIELKLKKDEAA